MLHPSRYRTQHGSVSVAKMAVAAAVVVTAAVWVYTQSDAYTVEARFTQAEKSTAQNDFIAALDAYEAVLVDYPAYAARAADHIKQLLSTSTLESMPAGQLAAVIARIAPDQLEPIVARYGELGKPDRLFEVGRRMLDQHRSTDLKGANRLIKALIPLAADPQPLRAFQFEIVQKIVALDAGDVASAVDLAELYEMRKMPGEAKKILIPHESDLGDSEGARILGERYAEEGKTQRAMALLKAYTEQRLTQFKAIEKQYNDVYDNAWRRYLAELKAGLGPDSFWKEYNKANENDQETLVQNYVAQRADADPQVARVGAKLRALLSIVEVALELGVVTVNAAHLSDDAGDRKQLLQDAEKTFLAIKGVAQNSGDFQFYLGQVYYWLGKPDEGKALFDQLLEARKRDYPTLIILSGLLREVGESAQARVLVEEAYVKSTVAQQRYAAAHNRALLNTDIKDEIVWLKRADPDDWNIKASLLLAQGHAAESERNFTDAKRKYKDAINVYAAQPLSKNVYNNEAVAYFDLYRVGGGEAALTKGLQLMDQAVSIDPTNSISLFNVAGLLVDQALSQVVGDALDLNALGMTASPELLSYLYSDQEGKNKIIEKMRRHESMQRGIQYYQKVILLSPKRMESWNSLYGLLVYMGMEKEAGRLAETMLQNRFDFSDAARQAKEYQLGNDNAEVRDKYHARIRDMQSRLGRVSKVKRVLTYALAENTIVSSMIQLAEVGGEVDERQLLNMSREAYALAPSSATAYHLVGALLHIAVDEVSKANAAFKSYRDKTRRKFNHGDLCAAILMQGGESAQALLKDTHFQEAVALTRMVNAKFTNGWTVSEWVMLSALDPAFGVDVGRHLQSNGFSQWDRKITEKFADSSESSKLKSMMYRYLQGDTAAVSDYLASGVD